MNPPLELPAASRALDLEGFALGHGTDRADATGVTVVLCPEGAVAAAEVRGTAAGTRQFDSLVSPLHLASRAQALVFSGGSGFGLAAADPVVDWLAARGRGFATGIVHVPLVPTAILFDLGFAAPAARPHATLAVEALAAARGGAVERGSVGAGTGATVGKLFGLERAMKGGFGFAALTGSAGATVAAAVVVNAWGDVRDPDSGALLAGCRLAPDSRALADTARELVQRPPEGPHPWQGNTTLAAVLTDARLTKLEAHKICQMAFGGFYRALSPALGLFDGDLVATFARGEIEAPLHQIGVLAERAVALAIVDAVLAADGLGRLPAARDLAPR